MQEFKRGHTLVAEGVLASKIFIIREGECKIELQINPLQHIANLKNPKAEQIALVDTELKGNRGFFSPTLSHFLIGTMGENEWIGNDFVYTGVEEYEYTATAITDMSCYETTVKDLSIMPSEFQATFRESLKARQHWFKERMSASSKAIASILEKQDASPEYDDTFHKVTKKYPCASKEILLYIRKRMLFKRELDNITPSIKSSDDTIKKSPTISPKRQRRDRLASLNIQPEYHSPDSSTILNERKHKHDLVKCQDMEKIKKLIHSKNSHATSSSPLKLPERRRPLLNTSIVESLSHSPVRGGEKKLIALVTQRERKSKIELLPTLPEIRTSNENKKMDMDIIKRQLKKKFEQKEYTNITICRRNIEIKINDEGREKTPNPFGAREVAPL